MMGLAYAESEACHLDLSGARWLVPLALALLVHCVPMFCLTLSATPELSDDATMSVEFTDLAAEQPELAAATEPGIKPPAALNAPAEPPRATVPDAKAPRAQSRPCVN